DSYFFTQLRYDQWISLRGSGEVRLDHSSDNDLKFGTVGAVAVDSEGNLAAATSTGGMTNKAWGRVGDSPLIGAGTYANNKTCAVSCTGYGEFFIRGVVAYDVSCLMEFGGMSLEQAANEAIFKRLKKLGGEGGLISVDAQGNICLPFNTEGMYRGLKNNRQTMTQIL
ncbi:MAG: beta-aspartyl-peptidase, partial [Balneolaceae bacterium]